MAGSCDEHHPPLALITLFQERLKVEKDNQIKARKAKKLVKEQARSKSESRKTREKSRERLTSSSSMVQLPTMMYSHAQYGPQYQQPPSSWMSQQMLIWSPYGYSQPSQYSQC
jgi:hypothetical protein